MRNIPLKHSHKSENSHVNVFENLNNVNAAVNLLTLFVPLHVNIGF